MPLLRMFPQLRAMLAMLAVLFVVFAWDTFVQPLVNVVVRALSVTIPLPSRLPDIHLDAVGNAIRSAAASLRRHLGELLALMIFPAVVLLQYATRLLLEQARETAAISRDTAATIAGLRKVVIPAMIAAKVAWIPRHLIDLERRVAALAHRAPVHIVKDITHVVEKATTTVVKQAVALPFPRLGRLEREAGATWKRVNQIAKKVTPAALAAAVVLTVARSSFRWVRCSRVRRVGRAICGMDDSVLNQLLTDALLIVGTVNLVQLARQLEPIVEESAEAILHFWTPSSER
jgi:hypothetical protein